MRIQQVTMHIDRVHPAVLQIKLYHFRRRHPVVFLILKTKQFYFTKTQQQHTIISTLVWLCVSVSSRPSSGQHFPVEGTIGARYILWVPILLTGYATCCQQYFNGKKFTIFYAHPVNNMGSHNVQRAPILPSTGKCWPEDGLETTATCRHTRVLMIVCYCCASTE